MVVQLLPSWATSTSDDCGARSTGSLGGHQRVPFRMYIRYLEVIGRDLAEVEATTPAAMRSFAAQQVLLVIISGVDALTAALVSEIGMDMALFGTAQRRATWASRCPANYESAGEQMRRRTRKGNPYLKDILVPAAVCGA